MSIVPSSIRMSALFTAFAAEMLRLPFGEIYSEPVRLRSEPALNIVEGTALVKSAAGKT